MPNRHALGLVIGLLAAVLATHPAHAQYHIFWGDMHGHTAHSDGKGSLDDYFRYARDVVKLDFVVVSDHDFGNAAPWKMPKETWTLTQDKADEHTVGGKFVAIAGYEWTSQPKYWTPEEPLFQGPVKYYNHKNVCFLSRVDYLFSAKDPAYNSPKPSFGPPRWCNQLRSYLTTALQRLSRFTGLIPRASGSPTGWSGRVKSMCGPPLPRTPGWL
jgi:hypothetical protein